MATVPYRPVPDVAASQQGVPGVDVPTPIQAFGGTIAQAIESVGRTTEHAGDEIFKRAIELQTLENETIARDADTEFTIKSGERRAAYHALEGQAAEAGYKPFVDDMRKMQQEARAKLPNRMAQRIFDRESQSMMARTIFNGAGHAASQARRWREGSVRAGVDATQNDLLHDPTPANRASARVRLARAADDLAKENGWDQNQRDAYFRDEQSKATLTYIQGLARQEPFEAKKFLEEHRDELSTHHIQQAEQFVKTHLYQTGSRRIISEIVTPVPEGEELPPRRDTLDAIEKRARELVPNDEDFVQYARDAGGAAITKREGVKRDDAFRNRNIVEGALMGGFGEGRLPTTVDELIASDPTAQDAWERLDNITKRKYMSVMQRNARGDFAWDPQGNRLRRWQQLQGMSNTDPEEFLGLDLSQEQMPASARLGLIRLQERLKQRPEADPRVTRALQTLGPMLRSAGISRDLDKDRYQRFVGSLQSSLQDWQRDNPGKTISQDKDVKQMGLNLLGEMSTPRETILGVPLERPGYLFGLGIPDSRTPMYDISIPQQAREEFTEKFIASRGRKPTDADIEDFRQELVRRAYQNAYGRGAKPRGSQ